jgi:hypothetical protein
MTTTTHRFTSNPDLLKARWQLIKVARLLIQQEHRIFEIQQALPLSASHLAMEEESVPYSAASWMYVELAQIQARGFRRTVRQLLTLSKKTDHELANEFCGLAPRVSPADDYGPEVENLSALDRFRVMVLKTWPNLPDTLKGLAEEDEDEQEEAAP